MPPFPPPANETVKAPGNLVVSAYVTCPDVTKVRAAVAVPACAASARLAARGLNWHCESAAFG